MEVARVVEVLGALAQETRLEVFRLLVEAGPEGLAAGEIGEQLDVPAPTLSFHLRALSHAGLVSASRSGRSIVYAADFPALEGVLRYLTENCCAGSVSLERAPARRRRQGG